MQKVLAVLFFLIISDSCHLIHAANPSPVGSSETVTAQSVKKLELEMRKLELETKELERRVEAAVTFGIFNEPFVTSLVTTILTLFIGGLVIGALGDIRARKNKRLDEYHLMINNVAGDLSSVFTPLYQYIRHPSHRPDAANHETADEEWAKKVLLRVLHERIPQAFERRLSLYVTSEALIPSKGATIARDYFDICIDLQRVARQLWSQAVRGTYDDNKIPLNIKTNARTDIDSGLMSPFTQFEQWVAGIWIRANELLTITIKDPNQAKIRRIWSKLFPRRKQPLPT